MAVHLGVEPARPQRRVIVALRGILAIPHFLFGYVVLGIVAWLVMVIAWFAALFTARVPHGIADLLARILQYQSRMFGYGQMLLTDQYPPFTIGPADYPIELSFDEVGTFNRAAVLFRIILALPALILTQLLTGGLTVALFFIWLVTLISGRVPDSAHMALASALRYQMRTYAYTGLVTTEYPSGLFGDRDVDTADDAELPETPHITRFVLSRAAKNLLILFIVLGCAVQAANTAVTVSSFNLSFETSNALERHHDQLLDDVVTWSATAQSCAVSGGPECLRSANTNLGVAFDRFQQQIWALDVDDSALDEVDAVSRDIADVQQLLASLSSTTDAAEYQQQALALQDAMFRFDASFEDLHDAVLFT